MTGWMGEGQNEEHWLDPVSETIPASSDDVITGIPPKLMNLRVDVLRQMPMQGITFSAGGGGGLSTCQSPFDMPDGISAYNAFERLNLGENGGFRSGSSFILDLPAICSTHPLPEEDVFAYLTRWSAVQTHGEQTNFSK